MQHTKKYIPSSRKCTNSQEIKTMPAIKQKQLKHNLTFIKDDKGNCIVVMKTQVLQEKVIIFSPNYLKTPPHYMKRQ